MIRATMPWTYQVSIQLISPASGNTWGVFVAGLALMSFHSINIPSEWEFI